VNVIHLNNVSIASTASSRPVVCLLYHFEVTFQADGYCDANMACGLGCPELDLFEGSKYDMQVIFINSLKFPLLRDH
jgi:hypothetical protein